MIYESEDLEATGETEGSCGDGLTRAIDTGTGCLTISGNGAMRDFAYGEERWGGHEVKSVSFTGDITRIGALAFSNCNSLTEC